MKQPKGIKGIIVLVIMGLLVGGYFFYLSNKMGPAEEETTDSQILTQTQLVLSRDLATNYPPTPREVVKYFSEVTQCYYGEEHDDEELKALGLKMRGIYDNELINNQSEQQYLDLLKKDIQEYKDNNRTIISYSPSPAVDVETFVHEGHECAKLYCMYDIKQDSLVYHTNIVFILRKDDDGHYKIYGWKNVKNEDNTDVSAAGGDLGL